MPTCIECGQEFDEVRSRRHPHCPSCSLKHYMEAVEQMSNKEGPYYEKWLMSKGKAVKHFRDQAKRMIQKYEAALNCEVHLASPVGQAEMIVRCAKLLDIMEE